MTVRVLDELYRKYEMKLYEYLFIKKEVDLRSIHFGQDCR